MASRGFKPVTTRWWQPFAMGKSVFKLSANYVRLPFISDMSTGKLHGESGGIL